jgi:cytochrome c553
MKLLIILIMALGFSSISLAKGNAKKGKAKSMTCVACHGPKGISLQPIYPNLAGQKEAYLLKQLKAFKSGTRKSPMMKPMVAALSAKDMANLAAYYSSLKTK